MEIDDELATYLSPGPYSIIVASGNEGRFPEAVRAWGPKLSDDRRSIDVFVGRQPSLKLRENLQTNNAMAVAIANVTTYQALQLKGRCLALGEAEDEDIARVRAHGEAFVNGVQLVGVSERAARGILVADVVKLTFAPEMLFDQTPGPQAGVQRWPRQS